MLKFQVMKPVCTNEYGRYTGFDVEPRGPEHDSIQAALRWLKKRKRGKLDGYLIEVIDQGWRERMAEQSKREAHERKAQEEAAERAKHEERQKLAESSPFGALVMLYPLLEERERQDWWWFANFGVEAEKLGPRVGWATSP